MMLALMLLAVFMIAFFLAAALELTYSKYIGAKGDKAMPFIIALCCAYLAFYFT